MQEPSTTFYTIRFFVDVASAIILALVVLGIRIPGGERCRNLKIVKLLLFAAFFSLGTPIFTYKIYKTTEFTLFVSYLYNNVSYSCLMLASAMLAQDGHKNVKVLPYLSGLVALCAALQVFFISVHPIFDISNKPLAWCMIAITVACMSFLTALISKDSRTEEGYRRTWWCAAYFIFNLITIIFYQMLLPAFPSADSLVLYVNIASTAASIWFVIKLFDYAYRKRMSSSSGKPMNNESRKDVEHEVPLGKEQEEQITERLSRWVEKKQFLNDESIEIVAASLGTDLKSLRIYFRNRIQSDFRSWRIMLRIEYAKELIKEDSGISLNKLSEMSGFQTKGNFYSYFKKITGMTPSEYKDSLKKRSEKE